MRHRLARTMVARLTAIAQAAARAELAQMKAAGATLETKGLIDDVLGAASDWIKGHVADKVVQIAESTRKVLRRVILASHEPATPPRKLAKQIIEATGGEIGKVRAIRIARTEAHTSAEKGSFEAMRTVNIEVVKEWGAVEDKRTRQAHAEADGQTVAMTEAFTVGGERLMFCGDPNGSARNIINCFPAETVVSGFPLAVTRHWYDGPLVEITTTGGHKLSGTPNHPVLTDAGWKPLHALVEGDNVATRSVRVERMAWGDPDVEHMQSTIGELFDTAARVGQIHRVSGIDVDFHGDRPNHDVDIAVLDGKLRNGGLARTGKGINQISFVTADTAQGMSIADSATAGVNVGLLCAPDSAMSGGRECGPFLGARTLHSEKHGLSTVANRPAGIIEALSNLAPVGNAKSDGNRLDRLAAVKSKDDFIDEASAKLAISRVDGGAHVSARAGISDDLPSGHSADAEPLGTSLVGETGSVSLDEIASISIRQFSGHVFNLEDHRGNYTASRIVVHNCRCVTLYNPVLPTAEPEPVLPAVPVKPALGSVPVGATWGPAHEAAITKGMSAAEIAARSYVVEEGIPKQAAKQEFAAVVDGGKLVQKYPGAKQFVHISPEAAKLINDPSKRISFHHNHPSDSSFSEADIGTSAQSPGLYELWAHGNAGSAYRLRAVSSDVVAVTGEFRRVRAEVIQHLQSLISAHKMTVEQAQAMDSHAVSVVLSRAGWFDYHAVLSPSKAEILQRRADVFDELVKLGLRVVQRATKAAEKRGRRSRFMIDLPSLLAPDAEWQEMLATLLAMPEQSDPGVIAALAEVREELARRGV
jgi:hypothetical protein